MTKIRYFDTVTSTNDVAKQLALGGEAEGTVIVANHQSAGRGRMGRSFMSPSGTGLYMSILLRPKLSVANALLITTAAAVAVAKAIEKHSCKATQIKWVNDIFIDGKKVCGILTEGQFERGGTLEYAILGIGVNLTPPKDGFGELENIAGAVFESETYDKTALINEIIENFFDYYKNLDLAPHYEDYAARDLLHGKTVSVLRAGEELYSARVHGIDRDFSLIIEHDGKKENLTSGEVSIKLK